MKTMLFVFSLFSFALALNPTNYGWTPLSGQVVPTSGLKGNFDSLKNGINQCKDTLNKTVPRMVMFRNHDSTFNWMNIDTLPSVDTINAKKGKVDTLFTNKIALKGNQVDSGNLTVTGNITVDSLKSTKGIVASTFYGNLLGGTSKTFQCSLFDNTTYRAVVTAKYAINGNTVTLSIPSMNGTLSGGDVFLKTIPSEILTDNFLYVPAIIFNNGVDAVGMIVVTSLGYFYIRKANNGYPDAGEGGTGNSGGCQITYLLR